MLQASIHGYLLASNSEIAKEITGLQDFIKSKAENYEKMKELEVTIERIKKTDHKRILSDFADVKQWFNLLYSTVHHFSEEDIKQVYLTATLVYNLMNVVEQEEIRLQKEKEELESRLKRKRDEFEANIADLFVKIEALNATYTSEYAKEEACKTIEGHAFTLKEYIAEVIFFCLHILVSLFIFMTQFSFGCCFLQMQEINIREDLIGWSQTEFPRLQEAENNLKPYQDLWFLIRDKSEKIDLWKKNKSVFLLDPEEIEKEVKFMFSTANKLRLLF